jgi:predicted RNA-binding Zn-ribbon protein involved in translation (DUF1610 family)
MSEVKVEEVERKAYRFICPICGRELVGLWREQVSFNAEQHMKRHRGRR